MRKQSILVGLVAGAMVLFAAANYYMQLVATRDSYAEYIVNQEKRLAGIIEFSKAMGQIAQWDQLRERLEDFRQEQFIDFYILQYKGQPVWWASLHGTIDEVQKDYNVIDQPVRLETKGENPIYQTSAFGPDFKLTIGFVRNREAYVARTMERFRAFNIEEWIFFGLVVLVVAVWSLRDLLLMAFRVSRGDTKGFFRLRTHSSELDVLARGFSGFANAVEVLDREKTQLERQVLPALKTELFSGRQPPYSFDCTLVRVDINGFTHIYNSHDVRELMASVNEFFVEVSHVVSRYNGLVSEFIGDEVIFYFKDEASPNSVLTALSALRDIAGVAEGFDKRLRKERGYGFTIKASLAQGSLHFGPLVNGYSLAGAVLIETVRLLSVVSEKDGNTIIFDSRHLNQLDSSIKSSPLGAFSLKGFKGDRSLVAYNDHREIDTVLTSLRAETADEILAYRSDTDLLRIVNWLRASATPEISLQVLKQLRTFSVTRLPSELVSRIFAWVEEMRTSTMSDVRLLTSVLGWLPHVIPQNGWTARDHEQLARFSNHPDARLRATLIEVLAHFGSKADDEEFERHASWRRARINQIVRKGKDQLSAAIAYDLQTLLKSSDQHDRVGALYAIGEIAQHHLRHDRVYLATRVEFIALFETVAQMKPQAGEHLKLAINRLESQLAAFDWSPQTVLSRKPA